MRDNTIGARQWTWLPGPLAMCFSTILVVAKATGLPVSIPGATLFTAGVVTAYTWDRWVDCPASPRPVWCLLSAGCATLVGLAAALWLPLTTVGVAMALGVVGLAYRSLKKIPLAKTMLIALAWAVAGLGFSVATTPPLAAGLEIGAALFAVFAAGALLCDFKDIEADARGGVGTAQVLWGPVAAACLAAVLALLGVMVAAMLHRPGLACAGVVLAGLSLFPRLVSRPVLGPLLVDGALALPAVFILSGLT